MRWKLDTDMDCYGFYCSCCGVLSTCPHFLLLFRLCPRLVRRWPQVPLLQCLWTQVGYSKGSQAQCRWMGQFIPAPPSARTCLWRIRWPKNSKKVGEWKRKEQLYDQSFPNLKVSHMPVIELLPMCYSIKIKSIWASPLCFSDHSLKLNHHR